MRRSALNRALLVTALVLGVVGISQPASADDGNPVCSTCENDLFIGFTHYFLNNCCESGGDCYEGGNLHTEAKGGTCGNNHGGCGAT